MTQRKLRYLVLGVAVLLASSCNNLDVTNPNQPDIQRALSSPADVQSLAVSTLNSFYITVVSGDGGEPDAGRRLLSWAHAAGFADAVWP